MKIIYDIDVDEAKETLIFNDKKYEMTWVKGSDGIWRCGDNSFDGQLENDGYDDAVLLDKIYEIFDTFYILDCVDIAKFESGITIN